MELIFAAALPLFSGAGGEFAVTSRSVMGLTAMIWNEFSFRAVIRLPVHLVCALDLIPS